VGDAVGFRAFAAWKGLSALAFKVCNVRGPKVSIAPEKLAEFQTAPLSTVEEVKQLEKDHLKYEELLAFMATGSAPVDDPIDPRDVESEEAAATASSDLITFESEAALRAHAPDLVEIATMSDKHVLLLKDQARREVYLLSQKDDHILPALTLLGGFGGGVLQTRNDAVAEAIPWALPKGDKESVQLMMQGDDDDTKNKSKKAGSLYATVKPLEKKAAQAGTSVTITAYGKLQATTTQGMHHFTFQYPDGEPRHKAMDYILKNSAGKASSGNFFASLADRRGWQGSLGYMWRLVHDPVRHQLAARKPFVVNEVKISLKKGIPVKVAWPKTAMATTPPPTET